MGSQDRDALTSRPSGRPEKDRRGDTARSGEVKRLRREIGDLKGWLDRQNADMVKLRGQNEKLKEKCKRRDDRIARLEQQIEKMHGSYQGVVGGHTQHARAMERRLEETEQLLATRSAELSGAQTFLSTTDRLSEVEVLGIVRNINENIYQVAVNLTEEWEKLGSSRATSRTHADQISRPRVPALVRLVRNRDPTGLTFLLQSCLCSQVVNITSSWGHHRELATLVSIYQRLSASGECRIVGAG
jgi:septation ring formation regulator EzrA